LIVWIAHLQRKGGIVMHPQLECLNAHYHPRNWNMRGASILREWLIGQRHDSSCSCLGLTPRKPIRIAPLCEFGGASFQDGEDEEMASGTYAVCPNCFKVSMCGYNDYTGLEPKACNLCGAIFSNSDYFQPIYPRYEEIEDFYYTTMIELDL